MAIMIEIANTVIVMARCVRTLQNSYIQDMSVKGLYKVLEEISETKH